MFPKLRSLALVLTLAWPLAAWQPAGAVAAPAGALMLRAAIGSELARAAEPRALLPRPSAGVKVVRFARRLLGVPYVWGGDSPRAGFDCSGLVRYVYADFGVRLPHSSYADFDLGVGVPRRALSPGDLVFFNDLGHVGIYVGDGRFIQAPHTGGRVQIRRLSAPWYESAYDGARRLLGRAGELLRGV